jgi:predicted RNA-binding protein associated with RNAse of E/G family
MSWQWVGNERGRKEWHGRRSGWYAAGPQVVIRPGRMLAMSAELFHDYDYHPYESDVRVFTITPAGVLRADDILVYRVMYERVVLLHYAFRDRWYKINVTTDLDGNLVETAPAAGLPAYAFNIDIATPMLLEGAAAYSVDLDIDVLVRADGTRYVVGDEQAFDESVRLGRFAPNEADGARAGLAELVDLIEQGKLRGLVDVLSSSGILSGRSRVPTARPVARVPLAAVPQLQPRKRWTWTAVTPRPRLG